MWHLARRIRGEVENRVLRGVCRGALYGCRMVSDCAYLVE